MGGYDSPFKSHVSSYGYDLQGFLSECCGHPDRFDGFALPQSNVGLSHGATY